MNIFSFTFTIKSSKGFHSFAKKQRLVSVISVHRSENSDALFIWQKTVTIPYSTKKGVIK